MKTLWKDLIVYDDECRELGRLGEITQDRPEMVSVFNPLDDWPDHFIAAEGEEPDWNTPKGEVDWEGFKEIKQGKKINKEQYDIEDIAIRIEELLKIEEDRAEQVKGIAILKNIVEEIKQGKEIRFPVGLAIELQRKGEIK